MNISLILTKQCSLRCRYCFETHENVFMTRETAFAAIDLLAASGDRQCGISFFGGEPLLQKELIMDCVAYTRQFPAVTFRFNTTTNGLLLDEPFLRFARENRFSIAMSHDGRMSRQNRLYPDGRSCLPALDEKLALLLRYQPNAFIMATAAPDMAEDAAASVIGLFQAGVKHLHLAVDARPDAGWTEDTPDILSGQLTGIENFLLEKFRQGTRLFFQPFEEKILSLTRESPCHLCRLGKRKPYVDWDGAIYPCIQFGGIPAYQIGSVTDGIDEARREEIFKLSLEKPSFCRGCALESRCVNDCACLNFQQNGRMNEVSPLQCAWQQTLIRHADSLARRMAQANETRFTEWYVLSGHASR